MILTLLIASASAVANLPACPPNQLFLAFDGEGGTFTGMQQSGALLVIRNMGPGACTVSALPVLTFKDAKGQPLPVMRRSPARMHPGPVVAPIGFAAGAEVTAPLRWVSAPAFEHSRCLTSASVSIAVGGGALDTDMSASFCAPQAERATFDQPPLRRDPVLLITGSTASKARRN